MEAVGAASAIIAFLGFAAKAAAQIYEIYGTYKDASETVFRTTRDLRHLMRVLEQILEIVNDTQAGQNRDVQVDEAARTGHARVLEDLMTTDDGPLAACRTEIASILKILDNSSRIAWPLRKKDVEKHLENLERLKTQIGLAVQSQSMFVNRTLGWHRNLRQILTRGARQGGSPWNGKDAGIAIYLA
jgi:Na+-translocating ferredoxin:NAD+ oxidoreductase RNF subunit RnfB